MELRWTFQTTDYTEEIACDVSKQHASKDECRSRILLSDSICHAHSVISTDEIVEMTMAESLRVYLQRNSHKRICDMMRWCDREAPESVENVGNVVKVIGEEF